MSRRAVDERGLAPALEAVIALPALVALVGLLVVIARTVVADQVVGAAAADAARAASIQRAAPAGDRAAREVARASLEDDDVHCHSLDLQTDMAGLRAPLGTPSEVSVGITCTVSFSDVALPGFPGEHVIRVTRSSPVDTYRQR